MLIIYFYYLPNVGGLAAVFPNAKLGVVAVLVAGGLPIIR